MRVRIAVLTAIAALTAGMAHAGVVTVDPATGSERPVNWRWVAEPDAFKMALIMSTVSRHNAKIGDMGVVECVIGDQRRPVNCRTLSEPPGSRLAAAAARLASYYKAPAHDDAGASPIGRTVRVGFALTDVGGFG